MKDTTVKLSGHSKDRFLERFFAAEQGIEPLELERLLVRSKSSFSSLRVRKALLAPQRKIPAVTARKAPAPVPTTERIAPTPAAGNTAAPAAAQDTPFDPYAIGLVPIFQREGRDGLLAKLATVTVLDQLRQMAKAQQIILPQNLRSGDADTDAVRNGIADAVAKRIADRRAAAG